MSEREEFEAWASKEGWAESDIKDRYSLDCPRSDEYRNFGLQDFWEVWQTARKPMKEELAAAKAARDEFLILARDNGILAMEQSALSTRLGKELAAAKATAWLIENGSIPAKYRAMEQGAPIWVDDPNAALRFSRREDGEMFCAEDEDAWFVREHMWVSK